MPKISPFVFIKTSTFTTNKIQYRPLIISGCSGSGKTTLISFLTKNYPSQFELSLSHTTRKPRHTQKPGIDYIFLSQDQFQRNMRNNSYIQYFNVHGNLYGTHAGQLQNIVDKGKVCILDMDIQGAEHVYQKFDMWNFLFVKCKSVDVLKDRLQVRGTESKETMQKRLKNAEKQLKKLEQLSFYTHIVNDSIKECQKDLLKYINQKYSFNLNSI